MKRITKITLSLAALALLDVFPAGALAQHFSEWSPPVNLGQRSTPQILRFARPLPSLVSVFTLVPTARRLRCRGHLRFTACEHQRCVGTSAKPRADDQFPCY